MSLYEIFDPVVISYFKNKYGESGQSNPDPNVPFDFFAWPYVDEEVHPKVVFQGMNSYYIKETTPPLENNTFLHFVNFSENKTTLVVQDLYGQDNAVFWAPGGVLCFGMLLEGGSFTPEMFGLPGYGFYIGETYADKLCCIVMQKV